MSEYLATLVVRSGISVADLEASGEFPVEFAAGDVAYDGGWRGGVLGDWPDDAGEALAAYAAETGGPVLLASGAGDDDFVLAAVYLPSEDLAFTAWLGRAAAEEAGNDIDEYDPVAVGELLRAWSREAGLDADIRGLAVALGAEDLTAEQYLRVLLFGLGVPGVDAAKLVARYAGRQSPLDTEEIAFLGIAGLLTAFNP